MSTNPKNIIRPEYLKNFTKKVKTRFVLLEKGNSKSEKINQIIGDINSEVNLLIQNLNLKIKDRQLPYINLMSYYGKLTDNGRVRVFLRNEDTSYFFEQDVKNQIESTEVNSHILDFLIAGGYQKITISDLSCDAELVIDESLLIVAITDILLDIIMFNSYSFLKELDIDKKRSFSSKKYEFYKKEHLNSFYECSDDKIMYYSLAFSARNGIDDFDFDRYIAYWDKLINELYPSYKHKEKSIQEQLVQHVDKYELPKNLYKKFDTKADGAYLVLRTNRDRTEDIHPQLCSLFGIKQKKYRHGIIKIVPIEDFDTYVPLLEHLDVSAFKIVKATDIIN